MRSIGMSDIGIRYANLVVLAPPEKSEEGMDLIRYGGPIVNQNLN